MDFVANYINPFHINRALIINIIFQYLFTSFLAARNIPILFSVCCAAILLSSVALTYDPYDRWEALSRRLVSHGLSDFLDNWSQSDIGGHCWTPCALIMHS
jgi:hypothetical protein